MVPGNLIIFVVAISSFCCGVLACGNYGPSRTTFDGHKILRFHPETSAHLWALDKMLPALAYRGVDFWTKAKEVNQPVDVKVHPWMLRVVLAFAKSNNIRTEVVCEDVQSLINSTCSLKTWSANSTLESFFDSYQRLDEIHSFLDKLVDEYPNKAKTEVIGKSYEGRDMKVIKISAPSKTEKKKKIVWIEAGIHAREWVSPTTVLYLAHQLLAKYGKNKLVTASLDAFDFVILPSTNPDGYEYTHTDNRLWRKTRSTEDPSGCEGVDANRNFDWHWNETNNDDPCAEDYPGTEPFSEKESKSVADFLVKHKGNVEVYITLHSYSQLWMYPWGHTEEKAPRDAEFEAKAKVAIAAIKRVAGTEYVYGPISTTIYPVGGDTASWAYGVAKVPYAFAVELPPKMGSRFEGGFILPPSKIRPIGKETSFGIVSMIKDIAENGA